MLGCVARVAPVGQLAAYARLKSKDKNAWHKSNSHAYKEDKREA